MTISINIPDAKLPAIITAFTTLYGYQDNVTENEVVVPNPESKAQFTKRKIIEHLKEVVSSYEIATEIELARVKPVTDLSGVN